MCFLFHNAVLSIVLFVLWVIFLPWGVVALVEDSDAVHETHARLWAFSLTFMVVLFVWGINVWVFKFRYPLINIMTYLALLVIFVWAFVAYSLAQSSLTKDKYNDMFNTIFKYFQAIYVTAVIYMVVGAIIIFVCMIFVMCG